MRIPLPFTTVCVSGLFLFFSCGPADGQSSELATNGLTSVSSSSNQVSRLQTIWEGEGSTVVGTVHGVNITKDELLRDMWLQNAPAALDELLKQKAVQYAAEEAGVKITQDDLQSKERLDVERSKASSLDEILRHQNMTIARYQRICEGNMMLEEYIRQKMVTVDVKDYADWVKVRYIYIADAKYTNDPKEKDEIAKETMKKADKILRKIKEGADFAKVADQYTDSPENVVKGKKQGGYMGWMARSWAQFTPAFEAAVFKLKSGEISDPIRSDFGYYLAKIESTGVDAKDTDPELKKLIVDRKVRPMINATLEKIWSTAKMDNRLK
jgi:foldase protein PrsA